MSTRLVSNPPNPWASSHVEWIDAPPPTELQVFEEEAISIIAENDSPDLGFRFSVNPYRGCYHGCVYCYARPSHQYWDFGAGTDFERKIVVKTNAPEKLREAFSRRSWTGELVVLSGNTDCYQPLEASYRLTRRCLEVFAEFRNPVGIITKSALIRRDIDVLRELAKNARLTVNLSIPFADETMARRMEPAAPRPQVRFEAMRALADAGISVGVGIAPIVPGLNDAQVAEILERAAGAGATRAFQVLLRLPAEVKPVFFGRLAEAYPDRVTRVTSGLKAMQQGNLYRSAFGQRGRGTGARWEAAEWLFDQTCRKLGLNESDCDSLDGEKSTFRRPGEQGRLF